MPRSLAPITVLADALALGSASPPPSSGRRGFEYGWVRGTGSAAFIVGALLAGQAVSAFGLDFIVYLQAVVARHGRFGRHIVPELIHHRITATVRAPKGGVLMLLRLPRFRNLLLVAALILGSHAMHDAFAVIRWSAAGISPALVSFLWSESVAAEVLVFFVIGPALMTRLTPAGAAAIAAIAGMLRWAVMAQTTKVRAPWRWCSHCTASLLPCFISPACGCSPASFRPASKGRRRRSMVRSVSEQQSHCSP